MGKAQHCENLVGVGIVCGLLVYTLQHNIIQIHGLYTPYTPYTYTSPPPNSPSLHAPTHPPTCIPNSKACKFTCAPVTISTPSNQCRHQPLFLQPLITCVIVPTQVAHHITHTRPHSCIGMLQQGGEVLEEVCREQAGDVVLGDTGELTHC